MNPDMMETARTLVKEVMKRTLEDNPEMDVPDSEMGKYEELMIKIMMENKSPMEAMGFSQEMIEHIYAYGYRLYNNGSYKKAKDVFTSLTIFKPDDGRFHLGLAASFQRLGNWEEAAATYGICSQLDTKSPMPLFYMYECLNQLKAYGEAAECLKEAIARCGKEELFENIKARCLLLLKTLPKDKSGE